MMKKKLQLVFLIIITLYFSCHGQTKFEMVKKDFPEYGITIKIPPKWMFAEGSKNIKNKIFTSYLKENKTDTFNTISYSVTCSIIPENVSSDSIFNGIIQLFKAQSIGGTLKELSNYKIDSLQTIAYRYDFIIGNIFATDLDVITIINKNFYIIKFTGEPSKFDAYKDIIDEIIKSIHIKPVDLNKILSANDWGIITDTYKNIKYGIEIDFPKYWKYRNDYAGNVVIVYKPVDKKEDYISIGINVIPDVTEKNIKLFHKSMLPYLDKAKTINTEYEITELIYGKYNVVKTKFHSNMNNFDLLLISYLFIDKDRNRAINYVCTTTPIKFTENEKLFDDIFKTLKLE
jgi:hypothetical protein